jgi:gluconokinase
MRPLIERSALAIADIVAELDKLAPKPLPGTEKAADPH